MWRFSCPTISLPSCRSHRDTLGGKPIFLNRSRDYILRSGAHTARLHRRCSLAPCVLHAVWSKICYPERFCVSIAQIRNLLLKGESLLEISSVVAPQGVTFHQTLITDRLSVHSAEDSHCSCLNLNLPPIVCITLFRTWSRMLSDGQGSNSNGSDFLAKRGQQSFIYSWLPICLELWSPFYGNCHSLQRFVLCPTDIYLLISWALSARLHLLEIAGQFSLVTTDKKAQFIFIKTMQKEHRTWSKSFFWFEKCFHQHRGSSSTSFWVAHISQGHSGRAGVCCVNVLL